MPVFFLYKITNIINNKIYIGQTIQPHKRWNQHKNNAASSSPKMIITRAIKKYGNENFTFEVIACCQTQDDANDTETILVKQYESHVSTGKGYNATHGGMNAPKSEEWKQKMRAWHASMSPEDKEKRYTKLTQNYQEWIQTEEGQRHLENHLPKFNQAREKYLQEFGSPNKGNKYSDERIAEMSRIQTENPSKGFQGKHHSEESNEKNRQSHLSKPGPNLGKQFSEDHKSKLSAAKLGKKRKKFSKETIQKMKEASKLREANKRINKVA